MSASPVSPSPSWRSLLLVALPLALVVLGAEIALHRVAPMPRRDLEVDTGVDALEAGNPEVLVLGSSHAGAFRPLADRLGTDQVVVVTEEGGTMSAFDWVYRHRLKTFVDEKRADGTWVRDRLRHVLLITTYWDTCPGSATRWFESLPARAWQLRHYLADVTRNGVTTTNHNFPHTVMKRLFGDSMLIQDRGLLNLRSNLRGANHPDSLEGRKRASAQVRYRQIAEEWVTCHTPEELQKFESLLDVLLERGLEVTVIIYPQMAELLAPLSHMTTLATYSEYLKAIRARKGVRIVDHTHTAPLVWDDFEIDCDHLTPEAREKYVDWALANGLDFLKAAPTASRGAP